MSSIPATLTSRASSPPPDSADLSRHLHSKRPGRVAPYLFLTPYFIITAIFFVFPLFYMAKLAFYETNGPSQRIFVGLANFSYVLHDPDFYKALWNTTFFALCSIFIQLPLSLGLAMLLNAKNDRLKALFRLAIFAPNLVGQAFVAIMFQMILAPNYGLFNQFTQQLTGWGIQMQWLTDTRLTMPAVVIASLWIYIGFNMIYFLAALQNVDQSLVEAARMDGAGPVGVFFHVTVPAIVPVATFVVVTSTIGSFQLFELPFVLFKTANSGGALMGPGNSALTIVGYLYNHGFTDNDLGFGATVGWLLTFIIVLITLCQIWISSKIGSEK